YRQAYKLACEELGKVDIEEQCRKSGTRYVVIDSQELAIVDYLNQSYQITFPHIEVSLVDGGAEIPTKDKVLILHYLTQAKGTPIANKFITFKEFPEGANYFPTFSKRSIEPLIKHFGTEPQRLVEAAQKLGGRRVDYGDVAAAISAFSRIPVTLVLWRGDEEFPPQSNILFDASIPSYLSTYDVTVLCENITWKLVKFLREGSTESTGS
ncbi:MAG: DUF3786 domain-containing protein, partial [Dehalococcoidia bacterium]